MKNIFKKIISFGLTFSMISTPVLAGTWEYSEPNWFNVESNGMKNTGWYTEGKNDWYYMDSQGIMQTGWIGDYHFHEISDGSKGHMDYGWYYDGINWYFLNTVHDGTFGAKLKGWHWIDGYCYYFDSNGKMAASTITPDGYQVNHDGQWVENGIVQYSAGKGISSKVAETIYSGGNSGGKTIYTGSSGGSSGGSSNNSSDDEESTGDENNNDSTELKEINDFIYSSDLTDILKNAQSVNFEDESSKEIIVEQMNSYFKSNDDIIKEYNWADNYNSVGIEYENGGHDIIEVWNLDEEEPIPMLSNIATDSNAEYMASEINNDIMTLAEESIEETDEDLDEKTIDVLLLRSFDEFDLENAKVFEDSLKDEFDNSDYELNLTVIDDATVNDFKDLEGYDIVYIHAHGDFTVNGASVRWSNDTVKELYIKDGEYLTWLEEDVTEDKDELYYFDWTNNLITRYVKLDSDKNMIDGNYLINDDLYEYYYDEDSFEKSIFSYLSCFAGVNNKLSDILFNKGLHTFIAFDDSVTFGYARQLNVSFIEHLLQDMTISDAWYNATAKTGVSDLAYLRAICQNYPDMMEKINNSWYGADPILYTIDGSAMLDDFIDTNFNTAEDGYFDVTLDEMEKIISDWVKSKGHEIAGKRKGYGSFSSEIYIYNLNIETDDKQDLWIEFNPETKKVSQVWVNFTSEFEKYEEYNWDFLDYFCNLFDINYNKEMVDSTDFNDYDEDWTTKSLHLNNANISIHYDIDENDNKIYDFTVIKAK